MQEVHKVVCGKWWLVGCFFDDGLSTVKGKLKWYAGKQ